MSWQPDPTSLNQLIDLLIKAQSPDSNVQMMVYNVSISIIFLLFYFILFYFILFYFFGNHNYKYYMKYNLFLYTINNL